MLRFEPLAVGARRIEYRPVTPDDADFLRALYRSTREPELARVDWPETHQAAFIAHQFSAQTDAYTKNYPGAQFLVLRVDEADAGRLYVHERPDEIRIMDIALMPRFRKLGVGTAVLRRVLDLGAASNRRVSIHVEVFNPALRLYERLGFRRTSSTEVYALMEWQPRPPG